MKKILTILLTMVMLFGMLPTAAFAAGEPPKEVKTLFDLSNFKNLSDLKDFYVQNYNTKTGLVNEDMTVSMKNGVLTATNVNAAQGMIQLFDYPESTLSGKQYTVTATFRFEAYEGSKHDAAGTRGGIAYNITKGAFQGSWCLIRANSVFGIQTYMDSQYIGGYSNEQASNVLEEKYKVGETYTVSAYFYADDWYTVTITNSKGEKIGELDGMSNARCGSGIGLYVRGSTLTLTDFKVTEEPYEVDVESAFDMYEPKNGKKVFDLHDVKSETELPDWFAEAYSSSNVQNDMSAEIKDGVLTVINPKNSFGTVNLFRYDRAKTAGNKFVVSMTVALNAPMGTHHTGDLALASNGQIRGGICFNVKKGCVDGQWAVLRNGDAEQAELQSYTNAKNTNTKKDISLDPFENTKYTLRLIFAGDGSYTYVIRDEKGNQYIEMQGETTFNNDINFGVMSRNSLIVVSDFVISEFNEAQNNCVRYLGVQSPVASTIGETYSVRFLAGLLNLNGDEAGLRIRVTDGKETKEQEFPVSKVYQSISVQMDAGNVVRYTAERLYANHLMAVTFSNIPTNAGDMVFFVTPYYKIDGVRYEGREYRVIYDAGKMQMQYAEEGDPLPYRHEGTTLRLMTNNILTTGTASAEPRVQMLSAIYHTYSPDILALQEVVPNWYNYLPKYLNDEYTLLDVGPAGKSATYNEDPIYYKTDRFDVLEARCFTTIPFGRDDELTYGVFRDKLNDKIYIVFSLHWLVNSTTYPAPVADAYRQESAKVILQTIDELKAKYNTEYAFVMGDFNAIESTQSYKDITVGLDDAKYIAEVRSNTVNNTGHTLGRAPLIASVAPRNYDYILVNGGSTRVLTHDIIKNPYGYMSSDHCPVYVDLILK